MINKDEFKKAKDLRTMLEPLSKGEFLDHFKEVLKFVQEHKDKSLKQVQQMEEVFNKLMKDATGEFDNKQNNAQNSTTQAFNTLKGEVEALNSKNSTTLNSSMLSKMEELNIKMGEIKDGRDGLDADEEKVLKKVEEMLEQDLDSKKIRDSLEALEGKERIDVSAIKGMNKMFKGIDERMTGLAGIYQQGGSSSGGKTVKALDLSSQLNGSKRVFAIQTVWRVISVHLTSNPTIMRDGVDYTWTPTSITFTSEVSDVSLSAGQTLIITIAE